MRIDGGGARLEFGTRLGYISHEGAGAPAFTGPARDAARSSGSGDDLMGELSLDQANRIIAAALAKARVMELAPVGVAVLDAGGHLVSLQREDGLSFLRVRVCQGKAYGALGMGTHSRHLATRFAGSVNAQGFFTALNAMSDGMVVPLMGGVLIRDKGGRVLGAVGVSGARSEDDEACAVAGIEAIALKVSLEP
jgi:uncharacterized protein GlcG (DUF336 family)